MFQTYQSGPAVDVLNAKDKALPCRLSSRAKVQVFEKAVKGFIISLESPSIKMSLPPDEKASLNLIQPYLVLQLYISPGQSFSLELVITDSSGTKRRLIFSSAAKDLALTPLHVRIPNKAMGRGQWLNLSIDLISFTARCFPGCTFRSLDGIIISSFCKLRRIFTMRSALWDGDDSGEGQGVAFEPVPKTFEYPPGIACRNQWFHAGLIPMDDLPLPPDPDPTPPKAHISTAKTAQKRNSEKVSRELKTAVPGAIAKVATRVPPGTAPLTAVPTSPASMRSSNLMFRSTLTGLSSQPSRYDLKPTDDKELAEEAVEEPAPMDESNPWGYSNVEDRHKEVRTEVPIPECIEDPPHETERYAIVLKGAETKDDPHPVSDEGESPMRLLAPPANPDEDRLSRLSVRESIHPTDSLEVSGKLDSNSPEDSLDFPNPAFNCSSENPLDKVNSFRERQSHPPSAKFNHKLTEPTGTSIVEELEQSDMTEDSLEAEEQKLPVPSYYKEAVDMATQFRPFTPPFAGLDKSRSFRAPLPESEEEEEVELVLDPVLGCYYDPKTHEYYELKD